MGVGLGGIERGENLPTDHHHHPKTARLITCRDLYCLEEICRPIPTEIANGPHRAGEHNRLLTRRRTRHQVRRFLERIGTVGDYHAGHFATRQML